MGLPITVTAAPSREANGCRGMREALCSRKVGQVYCACNAILVLRQKKESRSTGPLLQFFFVGNEMDPSFS